MSLSGVSIVVLSVLGLGLSARADLTGRALPGGSGTVFVFLSGGTLIGGLLIRRSRRHLATSGDEALANDPRPPILYLRPSSRIAPESPGGGAAAARR